MSTENKQMDYLFLLKTQTVDKHMVVCLKINSEPSSNEKLHNFSKQIILIVFKKYYYLYIL